MGDEPSTTQVFYSIFRGNRNFYVKHQPPFNEDPETGKRKGTWVGIAKDKSTKEVLPLAIDKYKEHLEGGDGVAIEPLLPDNTCFLAVIDIDEHGINFTPLIKKLYKHGLKFVPFQSKSGGLHIYFFFKSAEPGAKVIETVQRVIDTFGLGRLYTNAKGKSKVEIFPKHAVLKPDSLGSCLFLPYYNIAHPDECRQKMISDEGKLLGVVKGLAACPGMFTSVSEINATLDALPYNDAPYCVQMLALTGALGDGDGRNDFIYQVGVYLKKKQKENFLDEMLAVNNELAEPQPEGDVKATFNSVMSKQLEYKCKTGPCAEYCDTKQCRKREYGVGKEKGNHFTGFAAWGEISRVLAEEPYYLWKVQVDENGPTKEIRIDGEADLMNEFVVARACVRCVNKAPLIVKPNDWIAIVNQSLIGIENRQIEVDRGTDTSEMSALKDYFIRYLTHKQVQSGQANLVGLGQVYADAGGYYFTSEGFKSYLRVQKFSLGHVNLREELMKFGAVAGEVSYETRSGRKTIKCWKKPSDAELEERKVYYEDVLDIDKLAVEKNPLNKVDDSFDRDDTAAGKEDDEDGEYKF